ncbi:MAG: hypothetical protein ACD_78C00175G0002, partial [uncultured bacterium (gcode 4)]
MKVIFYLFVFRKFRGLFESSDKRRVPQK